MPGLISDQLINNLRTVAYKQLTTPVKVHRTIKVEGPYGTDEVDAVVSEPMSWYVPKFKGSLAVQAGQLVANDSGAEFRFRHDADIQVGDRIEVHDMPDYIVQDVNNGASIQLYLKAWTERIE